MDTKPITLFIADDHQILLDGFTSIFEGIRDIEVVGTAIDGEEVLDKVPRLLPDVILLDIKMPKVNGVEACKRIHRNHPDSKIIAISMHDQMSYVKRMFQFGASGYLLKNDSAEDIEKAIREVVKGGVFVSPQIKDWVRNLNVNQGQLEVSDREREVLHWVAEGLTDAQIADKLFLSVHTVNTHRKRLLAKFDAKNSAELVKLCIEKGII